VLRASGCFRFGRSERLPAVGTDRTNPFRSYRWSQVTLTPGQISVLSLHWDHLLYSDPIGSKFLTYAILSEIVGILVIRKLANVKF